MHHIAYIASITLPPLVVYAVVYAMLHGRDAQRRPLAFMAAVVTGVVLAML